MFMSDGDRVKAERVDASYNRTTSGYLLVLFIPAVKAGRTAPDSGQSDVQLHVFIDQDPRQAISRASFALRRTALSPLAINKSHLD
ncbi:hypothetical protein J6590_105634, partial [Homalodisca vitripennis]